MKIVHGALSVIDGILTFIALTAIAALVMFGPEVTDWMMDL